MAKSKSTKRAPQASRKAVRRKKPIEPAIEVFEVGESIGQEVIDSLVTMRGYPWQNN